MEPVQVPILVALVAIAALFGVLLGRRSAGSRVRESERAMERSKAALIESERSGREDRRVQDLILGSMQEGVLLFDGDRRTAFANAALERHLGARPDAIGQLYPPALREMVTGIAESGEGGALEFGRDEPIRWLRAAATVAGRDGSTLLVVTDITEARRIEAVRRDFVANASHELKTPAASIQAAAETLSSLAHRDPASVPRFATQLEREAVRLSRIVADLLDLSRLESETAQPERVRLDVLVRDEAERFEERSREVGVVLDTAAMEPSVVSGAPREFALMVRNLIDNAIRYSSPGGRVSIRLLNAGETVKLTVADEGMGIPTKDMPRVFERFYRVDRARSRATGGTGLGLAIVKHVVENHGGSVEVASELGTGSIFTVALPADD